MDDLNQSGAKAIIDAGIELGEIRKTESGREFVILPDGAALHDLDKFRETPARQSGLVLVSEIDSFVRYVKAFGPSGNPRVFADINQSTGAAVFTAVLNYHEAGREGKAGWKDHRVTFTARQTPEWQTWKAFNRKPCKQGEFASFIEDNIDDIVSPPGAQMLEIAKTLEAKTSVEFKSGIRLENGDHQLRYVSETTGRAGGNGELDIPSEFQIGVPPFDGGPAYKITARLRYRINEGHLVLWYELVNPHKVIDAACKEMILVVKDQTDIDAFIGTAP